MSIVSVLKSFYRGEFDMSAYRHEFTPDICILEQYGWQRVFLPCDLKTGGEQNKYLTETGAYYLGPCYTKDRYCTYIQEKGADGRYPIPIYAGPNEGFQTWNEQLSPPQLRIKGELWMVPVEGIIKKLDLLRRNTVKFRRTWIKLAYPYRDVLDQRDRDNGDPLLFLSGEQTYINSGWMYEANPEYWEQHLDGGYNYKPCPTKNPLPQWKRKWLKRPYYEFE